MQAIVVTPEGVTFTETYPRPKPQPGEALIRVRLAGVCATDLQVISGYNGFSGVLGHEFVGEVVAGPDAWLGQRVVGRLNVGCGQCVWCERGVVEHCLSRMAVGIKERDGVFAEYVALPLTNLERVPDGVSDEKAVFTEPLAAVLRIREQVTITPGMRAAVIGPGRLGLLAAQVVRDAGASVIVLGRQAASLVLPLSLGLEVGMSADAPDAAYDLVVEASGSAGGLQAALRIVRSRGAVIIKSSHLANIPIDLNQLVVREINLIGSRCGPFPAALALLAERRIQVLPLITRRFHLRDGVEALQFAGKSGVRKVLLELPLDDER